MRPDRPQLSSSGDSRRRRAGLEPAREPAAEAGVTPYPSEQTHTSAATSAGSTSRSSSPPSLRSRTGDRPGSTVATAPPTEYVTSMPASATSTRVGTSPGSTVSADAVAQSSRTPPTDNPSGQRASVPGGMSTGAAGNSTVDESSRTENWAPR